MKESNLTRILRLLSLSMLFICVCAVNVCCTTTESANQDTQSNAFKNLLSSVVKIDVWETSQKDGGSTTIRGVGSGVIMSKDGIVLTNSHVVNTYAKKIVVTLANLERVKAEFLGWDHWTDLAIIKIDVEDLKKSNIDFTVAEFGDSDNLHTGDSVYAVGTPHGFARTLTRGIVSNTSRFFEGTLFNSGYETGNFNTWIQTDAAINPGNSGGPLVDVNGKVIGINTRAYTSSNNLGFSVPSNVAKKVMKSLQEKGKVERAYIGITPAPLQDMEKFFDIDMNRGMLVRNVDALSPAATVGIVPGDIILKINSKEIDGRFPEQLPAIMNSIAELTPNTEVTLEVLHAGKVSQKNLKTELLESRVGREYTLEKWGVGIREITKVYAREAKIDTDSNLMVIGIRNGYPFQLAKIYEGDIIVSVNRKKISTTKELEEAYNQYCKNPKKTLIEISRDQTISYHILPVENK